jgi:dTDP-4-amino-4,6-dideoxygalactose transaminase
MCRVLKVHRSGYYAWLHEALSARAKANEALTVRIREFYDQSMGIYGSPRIFCDLREAGVACGENRVARLMRAAQIKSVRGYKRPSYKVGKPALAAPNQLQRQFQHDEPDHAWVMDITCIPVFVDIRQDTLNLDERLIEAAITPRTRVIAPVHYAGVSCEMDTIMSIAKRHNLKVVEDAAQGVMSIYKGRALGSIGDLAAYSFHETKNVISGEGGALLVNDPALALRAEIIREKGTDRSRFFRGEVDKYTWQEVGSSFLPGELTAAFLWAQIQEADLITERRMASWEHYHKLLEPLESDGLLRRPIVPVECQHNAHMYYVLLGSEIDRQEVLDELKRNEIFCVFHYVPLHSSPAGQRYGRSHGLLTVTTGLSERLIRLPLWVGLTEQQQGRIVDVLKAAIGRVM